ncbi:VTT domain-containing protein [Tabrizicola sp. J26]|nr:VTT domain-containing protein [Tabrizicola rongguiensis]
MGMETGDTGAGRQEAGRLWRRVPILVILVAAIGAAILFRHDLTLQALSEHHADLLAYRDAHYLRAVVLFMLAYTVIVTLSLPGATVATLTGGFLFGIFPGVLFNLLSATCGAVLIFLAARSGFGESLRGRITGAGGRAARLMEGIHQNELSVLFLMRLTPVVPFFLANLIPSVMGVSLGRFAFTTFFGIIPGALLLTGFGAGLGEVLAAGGVPDLATLKSWRAILPGIGLAVLAALPILIRLWRGRSL